MGRTNSRQAYDFDPQDLQGAGGLLGMLQAIMYQGQGQGDAGSSLNARAPGSGTPTRPQISDDGPAPSTRFTVRPLDTYSSSDVEARGNDGGQLDRLLALQAEQSRYQPTPDISAQQRPALDPNFRQLSRMPVEKRQQASRPPLNMSGLGGANRPSDNIGNAHPAGTGRPILSDATPDAVRAGSQYAQAALGLCLGGPPACAAGAGITAGPALLAGLAALMSGATILNQKKSREEGNRAGSTPAGARPKPGTDEWLKWFKEDMAARKRARVEAARKAAPPVKYDPNDFCGNRRTEDEKQCRARWDEYVHPDFWAACMDRAVERWNMCNQNGGRPHPGEKAPWDPSEEDVYINTGR